MNNEIDQQTEQLNKELNELKALLEYPRYHLTKFFDEIKTNVDVAYSAKELNELDNEVRSVLRNHWTQTIDKISHYETECYKTKNIFSPNVISDSEERIRVVEQNLDNLNKLILELNESQEQESTRCKINELVKLVNVLIWQTRIKLEEIVFLNKTVVFFTASKSIKNQKIFHQINTKTTAGKLLFIKDAYLSKELIEAFKNNSMSCLRSCNAITNDLIKLGQLKAFDLSMEPLDEISLDLDSLEYLEFTYMTQEAIECDAFKGFSSLKRISFTNSKFNEITEEIFKELFNLQDIKLENNLIRKINNKLFNNLTKLATIKLTKNKLEEIEANTFENLTNLKVLDLNSNQLKEIDPKIFKDLIRLEWISLSFNQLESIDGELFRGLNNLSTIQLNNNKLKCIDKNMFQNLHKLQRLNLANNRIGELDSNVFSGLVNLKSVCLSSNYLKRIDKDIFRGLTSLTHIELHDNKFECKQLRLNLEPNVSFITFKVYKKFFNDIQSVIKYDNYEPKYFYLSYTQWSYLFKFGAVLMLPIIIKLAVKY